MKWILNLAQVWSADFPFLHLVHGLPSTPVFDMMSYPKRTSWLSEMVSLPLVAKSWPSLSCLKSASMGVGGAHCCFILASFAVRSFMSIMPYVVHRCLSMAFAVTVAYFVLGDLRAEMYWLSTL